MLRRSASPQQQDRDLLRRIQKGDEQAFERLYERYARAALGLAIRVCADKELGEDVVQEAFLAIWRSSDAYSKDRGSVAAYVMGAVHHKAVDAVRREESFRRREKAAGEVRVDDPDNIEEEGWLLVMRDEVAEAMKKLSPIQREALGLAYFKGLTYSQVAERLEIPLGTAKTRLRDGMLRLRNLLADSGLGETL